MYYYLDVRKTDCLDEKGHEIIGWLIGHGADVHMVNRNKVSLVMLASQLCKEKCCLQRFLDAGVKIGEEELGVIMQTSDIALFKKAFAVQLKQEPLEQVKVFNKDSDYYSTVSAYKFATECSFTLDEIKEIHALLYTHGVPAYPWDVDILLKHEFDLELRDDKNRTLLITAIERRHVDMATKLVLLGANVSALTTDRLTALEYAQRCAHDEQVKMRASTSPFDSPSNFSIIIASRLAKYPKLAAANAQIAQLKELIAGSPIKLKLAEDQLAIIEGMRKEFWRWW